MHSLSHSQSGQYDPVDLLFCMFCFMCCCVDLLCCVVMYVLFYYPVDLLCCAYVVLSAHHSWLHRVYRPLMILEDSLKGIVDYRIRYLQNDTLA